MRHFYYRGISRVIRHPLLSVPKVVMELYQREQLKRKGAGSPPVSFSQGFLSIANCVYYAVENTLIVIAVRDLMNCVDPSAVSVPYIIHEVRSEVVAIL
jgi:hypothetical protein